MPGTRRTAAFWLAILLAVAGATHHASSADWPQFMRNASHTGDASDEVLAVPLGLIAQVRLDDAVMASPAVVDGLVYVADQMGTAYCVDPRAGRIIWKVSPDGDKAMGSNTSSPCVVNGRVYYGTTAGTFHILNAGDGRLVKTIRLGVPVISSPTFANASIYLQALDGVVRCLDLDGTEKWTWDHYRRYVEPPEITKREAPRRGHPGSYDRPHYGGGEVAVAGRRVVTSIGWDLVCLDDRDTGAVLAWCRRAPAGRDGAIPMSSSVSAGSVYTAGMGADGVLSLMRFSLEDGRLGRGDVLRQGAFPWITPAVRGTMVTCRNNGWLKDEIQVCEFGKRRVTLWQDPKSATPVISSHALSKDHCVVTTLGGELMLLDLVPKPKAQPFRFKTPHGKGIGSSPAISGGCVFFGCDDGYLYVLGPGATLKPVKDERPDIHRPRSKVTSATGKSYGWPSTCGNAGNTCFVDDPGLKPPLRLRWATRGFGHFKTPCVATEDGDVISVTLGGTVTCLEQATGRLRWRRRLPPVGQEWGNSSGLLAAGGRLYVPRPNDKMAGTFSCLALETGAILWSSDIGGRGIWQRSSPVPAAGKVAFGYTMKGTPPATIIQAWDADTGTPAWQVELNVAGNRAGSIAGCTDGRVMYFTAGAQAWQWKQQGDKKRGEAVAIDAATGHVLWRSNEVFGVTYPVLAGDRLLLNEYGAGLNCVSPKDGTRLWQGAGTHYTRFSVASDFIAARGYGGGALKVKLRDGTRYPGLARGGQLGGDAHACGPVVLTPAVSVAITVGGLHIRDVKTGARLWLSPGFAPRACVNPSLANGRLFFPAAANGMVFCWEPETLSLP